MLKAIVNYSKKIPAEAEYSSQGYSLSIETEITPGSTESIREQLHNAFELVRTSVEAELTPSSRNAQPTGAPAVPFPATPSGDTRQQEPRKASNKQIGYINALAANRGMPISELTAEIRRRFNAASLYDLSASEASQIIDEMNQAGRRQRAA